jgi:hypothetical protein
VEITLDGKAFIVEAISLSQACDRFANHPPPSSYRVTSEVTAAIFEQFLQPINGRDIEITKANAPGLSLLSSEFQFSALSAKLAAFYRSPAVRLSALESVI